MRSGKSVLLVDENAEEIQRLKPHLLKEFYVQSAASVEQVLALASSAVAPDVIVMLHEGGVVDGLALTVRLKIDPIAKKVPVLLLTDDEVIEEILNVDASGLECIPRNTLPSLVKMKVRMQINMVKHIRELERRILGSEEAVHATTLDALKMLGRAAGYKDDEAGLHVSRIAVYARLLGEVSGMAEDEVAILTQTAPLHDIGKIGIPESILLKPGKLDEHEWEIMKTHTTIGARIIGEHEEPEFKMAREIALCHHEKWNGEGYPQGLKGEKIPLVGRVLAIVDVFDSLTSVRPYKEAWPVAEALEVMKAGRGVHFDPKLLSLFFDLLPDVVRVKDAYAEQVAMADDEDEEYYLDMRHT